MGIFDFLKRNKSFVTEFEVQQNLENQIKMVPQTLEQLYKLGVETENELKVEYFFYSKTEENAKQIFEELNSLNYTVEYWKGKDLYVITGWTEKIKMSEENIKSWVKRMCEIGLKYDCEFDGWGTSPE